MSEDKDATKQPPEIKLINPIKKVSTEELYSRLAKLKAYIFQMSYDLDIPVDSIQTSVRAENQYRFAELYDSQVEIKVNFLL
ncbi:hypothetical protein HQ587_04285 [bacterium]|nr:hypothetical protein [bacterium]